MPSARLLILEYLKKHRQGTAAELSRSLGLTPADVRYHLKALRASGEIEPAATRQSPGRGRPALAYRLSRAHLTDDLAHFSGVLLNYLKAHSETPRQLADLFLPPPSGDTPLTPRLNHLIQQLNRHHYAARWEAHAGGPRVVFANCPFAPILANHPELCQMDRAIIERWSQMTAEQKSRIDPQTLTPPVCVFHLCAE